MSLMLVHSRSEKDQFRSQTGAAALVFGLIALGTILLLIAPMFAAGQETTLSPDDAGAILAALISNLGAQKWLAAAGVGIIAVVWVLRRFAVRLPKVGPFIGTSAGGTLFTMAVTTLLFVGTGLATGHASVALFTGGVLAGFTAIGGWNGMRRLLPLLAKIPAVGGVFKWLVPEDVGTRVAAETAAAYAPKTTTADQAAADLSKPPVT